MTNMDSATAPMLSMPQEGRIVVIEHPCVVRNFDHGYKSLGGEAQIVDVLDHRVGDSNIRLDGRTKVLTEPVVGVSLRPHDPLAKKILSTGTQARNVLVKVIVPRRTGRKRKRGSDEPFATPIEPPRRNPSITAPELLARLRDAPTPYTIEPIGHIPEVHRFRNPADFQLRDSELPIMQEIRSNLMRPSYNRLKQFHVDIDPGANGITEFPSAPSFASENKFYRYDYQQAPGVEIVEQDGQVTSKNKNPGWFKHMHIAAIPANAPTPDEPPPQLSANFLGNAVPNAIEQLKNLLDTRPIISRRLITNHFPDMPETVMKEALPWVGYSLEAGPFRDLIIKYGVDPRSDPKYRIYQSMMFKLDKEWLAAGAVQRSIRRAKGETTEDHIFDGSTVDATGKTWQVCDVTDPMLANILNNAPIQPIFNKFQWGWYHPKTLCLVRGIMRDKMKYIFVGLPTPDEDYRKLLANTDLVGVEGQRTEAEKQELNSHILNLRAEINSLTRIRPTILAKRKGSRAQQQKGKSGGEQSDGGDSLAEPSEDEAEGGSAVVEPVKSTRAAQQTTSTRARARGRGSSRGPPPRASDRGGTRGGGGGGGSRAKSSTRGNGERGRGRRGGRVGGTTSLASLAPAPYYNPLGERLEYDFATMQNTVISLQRGMQDHRRRAEQGEGDEEAASPVENIASAEVEMDMGEDLGSEGANDSSHLTPS